MSTANPTAITYAGQFSNQTLPVIAFASALKALRKKMGIVRWTKNKNFAGAAVGPGAQVPIPYVGRIGTTDITPAVSPDAVTAVPNSTKYMILDSWKKSNGFALTAQELSIFQMNSIVPRALERAVQGLAEAFESSAAGLAKNFPAVYGTPGTAAFASNANAIPLLRNEMSKNLCPNGEDVALFLRSTDVAGLRTTNDFKLNPQLAGLARAEEQYGRAALGEILSMVVFENQFISTRTPGVYTGAVLTASGAALAGANSIVLANSGVTASFVAGDSLKVASSTAPEGYLFSAVAANATLGTNAAGTITLTQPLEFPVSTGAAVTPQTYYEQGYAAYENLAITPDALAIANRVLAVGDLAEVTGKAWNVTDDADEYGDGTGLTFTLKCFPGSYQEIWEASIFYGMAVADCRLGGRLLSGGTSL